MITPYRAQKQLLMERLVDVSCNTVDAFQGNEFEAVVLSTVRASGATGLGFLSDDRRLNVALTRARQVLLVVGHEETLCRSAEASKGLKKISNRVKTELKQS